MKAGNADLQNHSANAFAWSVRQRTRLAPFFGWYASVQTRCLGNAQMAKEAQKLMRARAQDVHRTLHLACHIGVHMQTMPERSHSAPSDLISTESPYPPTKARPAFTNAVRDAEFFGMLCGYRRSGGLARSQEMALIFASRSLSIGTLAGWVTEGGVIHLQWQDDTWFPMFQFSGPDLCPSAGLSRVLTELRRVLDPWYAAHWFASPSAALSGRVPADAMQTDPDLVLHAARRDRYVIDA